MNDLKDRLAITFKKWLPFAVITVIFSALAYAVVQQNYRMSANDPQIQVAEDVVSAISNKDVAPDGIVSPNPTKDISSSLQPFVAIYSATGTPIGSSVAIDGKLPTPPNGAFDYAKQHQQDRFTWQPRPGVRIAAVVAYYNGGGESGFVLVGRSLKEIEIRENQTLMICAAAGLIALVLTFFAIFLFAGNNCCRKKEEEKKEAPLA